MRISHLMLIFVSVERIDDVSKKKKLTPKQEKFCQLYVNGATKADAYRGAYSTKTQSNNTVQGNA